MEVLRALLSQAVATDTLPVELSGCSPVFLAILGYLVGISTTYPVIIDLTTTSDGMILATHEGDLGFDHALSISHSELITNLNGLCDALDVSEDDRQALLSAVPV